MSEISVSLLALTTPEGVVMLVIAGSGIFLGVVVIGLGGWGDRDFSRVSKWIFGSLALIMFLFGAAGILLFLYPTLHPIIETIGLADKKPFISPTVLVLSAVVITLISSILVRRQFVKRKSVTNITTYTKRIQDSDCAGVIYEHRNNWDQYLATYAAIRIDGRKSCHTLKARISKISKKDRASFVSVDLNIINPTGDNLRWNQIGNNCLLHLVREGSSSAEFIFENRRSSPPIAKGEYKIEIEIIEPINNKVRRTKITRGLIVEECRHFHESHDTGLKWSC